MCGFIVSLHPFGEHSSYLRNSLETLRHRGPDDEGVWVDKARTCWMGHRRLSIIDLSTAGRQPMSSPDGRYHLVFNGEIYNYLEIKAELSGKYPFTTSTDTEVLLAAYVTWGKACLHRFIGMFSFVLWDSSEKSLWGGRDRFGVKPFYYHCAGDGSLLVASEIRALTASGLPRRPNAAVWSAYLSKGLYEHSQESFWEGICSLPPGGELIWSLHEGLRIGSWYDLAANVGFETDPRADEKVAEELLELLEDSVRLRFRADVPVGICLSGGLDSSLLLGLVHRIQGSNSEVEAFSFYCDDPAYDETPWIKEMLQSTRHPWSLCRLDAVHVPEFAAFVQRFQDGPFGGIPTLGMACVHARARDRGVVVLLDGNGIDEAWGGYDYYSQAPSVDPGRGPVQGTKQPGASLAGILRSDFAELAVPWTVAAPFEDTLKNIQFRDLNYAKIPRVLRFNDRVSMMYSRELREPFLDHRIVELGLRQPAHRKIRNGVGKWLVREVGRQIIPPSVSFAPKRPVQTPQREWLQGPLGKWAMDYVNIALEGWGRDWLDPDASRRLMQQFITNGMDNSFPIWQLINLGLVIEDAAKSDI